MALGLAGAVAVSRALTGLLYEVQAGDPQAMGTSAAVLVSAAILAALGPALRAANVDPMLVLRRE